MGGPISKMSRQRISIPETLSHEVNNPDLFSHVILLDDTIILTILLNDRESPVKFF